MITDLVMSVTDFVSLLNQTLEFAYPEVVIVGELANLRISKGKWVYFDLKDEHCSQKFFGTVFQMTGPLEDGMLLQVRGQPRVHPQFGFSVNVQAMIPVGEGSIKKAAALLEAKLRVEGLFEESRKRAIPYPPKRIGLIASADSAAYHDFLKIIGQRWGGLEIFLANVQVQGDKAVAQITSAIEYFSGNGEQVDVLVITRGGGSADDLAVFSTEQVTRAVAGSRVPTVVAIGHEIDISLAELAADRRCSTPSNAAEQLVPDRNDVIKALTVTRKQMHSLAKNSLASFSTDIKFRRNNLDGFWNIFVDLTKESLAQKRQLLEALSPITTMKRGYAIVRHNTQLIRSARQLQAGGTVTIQLNDGIVEGKINKVEVQ